MTSRLQSFETELLTQEENLARLAVINRELIAKAEAVDSPRCVVLDMDCTEVSVYGQQENSAYNGHFEFACYRPLPDGPLVSGPRSCGCERADGVYTAAAQDAKQRHSG